jgi:hypothetical protein
MCRKPIRLGMIILALGVSAGAAPSNGAPLPASASAQNSASPQNNGNAPAQSNASSQTKARPTPAQLDQPGAVVMAPPILRNAGRTFAAADQPLFGALNLQGQAPQRPLGEQPPAMQSAPNEAAIGGGAGDVGAPGQAHE